MFNSSTIPDNVNKYRFGVLIGNFNQQTFGQDLLKKQTANLPLITTTNRFHAPQNSNHRDHPVISKQTTKNTSYHTLANNIDRNQYKQPQSQSTYNIFYKKKYEGKNPSLQNNSKREEYLLRQNKLYDNAKSKLEGTYFNTNQPSNPIQNEKNQIISLGVTLTGAIDQQYNKSGVFAQNTVVSQPKTINPFSVNTLIKPQIKKLQDIQYKKLVLPDQRGNQRDILFGHSLNPEDFHKRQLATTYDLSYNQSIKPQQQINSFFTPQISVTAKQFHKEKSYQKAHQTKIPQFQNKKQLYNDKIFRPYAPYTKTFDQNHRKHEYLRK